MKNLKKFLTAVLATLLLVLSGNQVSADTQTITVGSGTGSITIDNPTVGKEYKIYKLFDATVNADGSGIAYKLPANKTAADLAGNTWFEVDTAGNVLVKAGITDADLKTPAFKAWATGFATTATASATVADGKNVLKFDQIPFGYYYITSSLGSVITVDSTKPNVSLFDKNDQSPKIPDGNDGGGKKIVDGTNTSSATTAKIGDKIDFQIKFEATNFETVNGVSKQITKYTIVDTPTNLAIDANSIVVKVAGAQVNPTVKTVTADGKMTLELAWVNGQTSLYKSPAEVLITYSAVVQKGAENGTADNTAKITYDTTDTPGKPVDPKNPDDTNTTVKTYKFTLNKVNETNQPLDGAEFKVYEKATGGNEVAVVKNADGTYRVAEAGEQGVVIVAGSNIVVKGFDGKITYWLEEIKAPNGYNVLTERKEIKFAEADTTVTVQNKKGAELPATGAMGTTMLYIAGTILLLIAIVYTISKRRMNHM